MKYQDIPNHKLGDMPEDMPMPMMRLVIAKRALVAAYEEGDDNPEQSIVDLITDLRHLSDAIGLDFVKAMEDSHEHYLAERHGEDFNALIGD